MMRYWGLHWGSKILAGEQWALTLRKVCLIEATSGVLKMLEWILSVLYTDSGIVRPEVWAPNMVPQVFLGGILGTLQVYSGYIRIPGLRAHTWGPWFQPRLFNLSGTNF